MKQIYLEIIGIAVIFGFIFLIWWLINKHRNLGKKGKIKEARHIDDEETRLINHINGAKFAGLKDKQIKQNLFHVGWDKKKVEKAFKDL